MPDLDSTKTRPPTLQSAQLIVGALLMGVVAFTIVAVVMVNNGRPLKPAMATPLGIALATCALFCIFGAIAFGRFVTNANRAPWQAHPDPVPELMLQPFVIVTILRAALLEGPALFGVLVFLVTGRWEMLIAAAAGVIGLLAIFPSRARFESFVSAVSGRR